MTSAIQIDLNGDGYLRHHGILGMKWGVRRYQNKDGSLTSSGKKRYNVDVEGAKKKIQDAEKEVEKRVLAYQYSGYKGKQREKLNKAIDYLDWTKDKLSSEKIKNDLNKDYREKSKRRLALEEHYKDKGMSQEEAEIAAYKRVRTEKIIALTAGLTIAAATAYVAYKHYDKTVDKIIKAGTEIQNISVDSNKGIKDAFYFSTSKVDNMKYRGIFGEHLKNAGNKVYETKFKAIKDLKVASEKSATQALSELVKNDKTYAEKLKYHLENSIGRYSNDRQNNIIKNAVERLNAGKIDSKVYDALNISLVDHTNPTASFISKGFYDQLKSKGYDIIGDMNDKKYSGYLASKPMIAFNGADKIVTDRVREVGRSEIEKAKQMGMLDITLKSVAPSVAAGIGVGALSNKQIAVTKAVERDKIVMEYKEQHPNTKPTYNQIIDEYYKR